MSALSMKQREDKSMPVTAFAMRQLPGKLQIGKDEVLVVLARLQLAAQMKLAYLDEAEQTRYHAYVFAADRQRHLLAHSLKREILAKLLNKAPAELKFQTNSNGKPGLSGENLQFNLSHSGDWVALAFSHTHAVGIDVEQSKPLDYLSLLPSVTHPHDDLAWPEGSAATRFIALWSMKEAVSKCAGFGLSLPFNSLRLKREGDQTYSCSLQEQRWQVMHYIRDAHHVAIALPAHTTATHIRLIELGELDKFSDPKALQDTAMQSA